MGAGAALADIHGAREAYGCSEVGAAGNDEGLGLVLGEGGAGASFSRARGHWEGIDW